MSLQGPGLRGADTQKWWWVAGGVSTGVVRHLVYPAVPGSQLHQLEMFRRVNPTKLAGHWIILIPNEPHSHGAALSLELGQDNT